MANVRADIALMVNCRDLTILEAIQVLGEVQRLLINQLVNNEIRQEVDDD